MEDQYSRTRRNLGPAAVETLRRAHVAVFGLGGVGGHAAEVLARSGVGELTLVDADTVALSNLNRQLVALHSTLGQYKVDVMAARAADIDPEIKLHAHRLFYGPDTADALPVEGFDYVLDCIDSVASKLLLAERCTAAGTPLLCCLGAGNKLDPMAFRVGDISETSVCPLARVMRLQCRKRGIPSLRVVWSPETPLPPFGEDAASTGRPAPASNAFVPAAAGLLAGATAVKDILRAAGCLRQTP